MTRPAWDRVAAVLLSALAVIAGAGSFLFSWFFVMATDSCGPSNCHESRLGMGYAVTWGGIAVAVIGAILGMVSAARRGTALWIWPALASLLIGLTWAGGAALAMSVAR